MASESSGTKGQPYFASGGAPAIDVDPGLVSDYAALVGNTLVSFTTPTAVNGKPLWNGLTWVDASGNVYIYQSGWQLSGGVPIAGTITPNGSAWSLGTGSSLTKQGKLVTIDAQFLKTSAINSNDVVGTLPAGFRPSRQIVRVGASTTGGSTGFVYYTINTNGQIVASYVNVTGTTSIWLGGITWSI